MSFPRHPRPLALVAGAALCAVVLGAAGAATSAAPAPAVSMAPSAQAEVCAWNDIDRRPSGHYYLAGTFDSVNKAAIYLGGIDQSGDASSSLGILDVSDPDLNNASLQSRTGREIYGAAAFFRPDGADSAAYFVGGSTDVSDGRGENTVYRYVPDTGAFGTFATSGTVSDHLFGAAAYYPDGNYAVVYGGSQACTPDAPADQNNCVGSRFESRVLQFDAMGNATWSQPFGGTAPGLIYGHSMVYDSDNDQMLIYGGTTDGSRASGDVFALELDPDPANLGTWTKIASGGPAARYLHSAAYDESRKWMVIHGGVTRGIQSGQEQARDDTWALDLTDPMNPTWVDLDTKTAQIADRVGGSMVYADNHMSVLTHAGRSEYTTGSQRTTGNTDALECMPAPTPTNTSPPVPTSTPGGATPGPGPGPTWEPPAADYTACPRLVGKVPQVVIDSALANPQTVQGYGILCNPGIPPSPSNVYRDSLNLQNPGIPYHPTFNRVVWQCGCR